MTLHPQKESDLAVLDPRAPTDTCLPGLHAFRERVRIRCTAVHSPTRTNNGLVGLNRVSCQPNHGSDQALVQQTLLYEAQIGYPAQSSGLQSSWTASSDFGVDECGLKGKQLDACVYVLCPGEFHDCYRLYEVGLGCELSN
ncbi:unnamed protein product [Echinostoma caproni]|uniref:Uncharacterized protein n=1 Tax=Echinostoma caproni TaxID=27848 RepID=A0A183AIR2_9TREM|nr:unnamed protein product [Echinostoma caproni]